MNKKCESCRNFIMFKGEYALCEVYDLRVTSSTVLKDCTKYKYIKFHRTNTKENTNVY